MKYLVFSIVSFLINNVVVCQNSKNAVKPEKRLITTNDFDSWEAIDAYSIAISNNGNYVSYGIKNRPLGSNTLVVCNLINKESFSFVGASNQVFSDRSRILVFMLPGDSLCILDLKFNTKEYIPQVRNFKLFMSKNEEWIIYHQKDKKKTLRLRNLDNGKTEAFQDIDQYVVSNDGKHLIVSTSSINDERHFVKWINILKSEVVTIWEGGKVSSLILDGTGLQLAFLSEELAVNFSEGRKEKNGWYFKYGMQKAVKYIDNKSYGIGNDMRLEGLIGFSRNGEILRLRLKINEKSTIDSNIVQFNIWSYSDPKLQSQQLFLKKNILPNKFYLAALDLNNPGSVIRIESNNDEYPLEESASGKYVLITNREGDKSEQYWNSLGQSHNYICKMNDGQRINIKIEESNFSPSEKYAVGYDSKVTRNNLLAYEIATGITYNLTSSLNIPYDNKRGDNANSPFSRGLKLAGSINEDEYLLIYDNYDIWKVDPHRIRESVNLTNGRSRNLIFRFLGNNENRSFKKDEKVILKVFNTITKKSGFCQVTLNARSYPDKLSLSDYILFTGVEGVYNEVMDPIKARNSDKYVVLRQRVDYAPNISWTKDFNTYNLISNICPERPFKWLTSDMLNFEAVDGTPTQAVMYKPEDFDSTKRYPVLINYYDKRSNDLNMYLDPNKQRGDFNIPWFVSRDYLVIVTDIHYQLGELGESVIKSVEGVVKHLATKSYVDLEHIGIQGHSFGGYETNYLITHSHLFAAAVSSSGVSNLVSSYGSLYPDGRSRQDYFELRGYRMNSMPWERPDLYVKNSPIFHINKVSVPVLLLHNTNDYSVQFGQGLEFFTGLRRAGKRVWMIEYNQSGHGLDGKEYKDFIIRMTQFFDHFLKESPAPKWMTKGIAASMKGIESGNDLDSTGTCGINCKVCKKNNIGRKMFNVPAPAGVEVERRAKL